MRKMRMLVMVAALMVGSSAAAGTDWMFLETRQAHSSLSCRATAVCLASNTGDVLVAGYFSDRTIIGSEVLTSAGTNDIFIVRYDKTGRLVWARQFGGAGNEEVQAAAADKDGNLLIAGSFLSTAVIGGHTLTSTGRRDIFVAKFDSAGEAVWAKSFGYAATGDEEAFGVATDSAGSVYVTGRVLDTNVSPNEFFNSVVLKYDSAGSLKWVKTNSGTGNDQGLGIAVDGSDAIYVTGRFSGTASFGGTQVTSAGEDDMFLIKYDTAGGLKWAKQAGGPGSDYGQAVACNADGGIYVAGRFSQTAGFGALDRASSGGTDMFLAKYTDAGNVSFVSRAGGPGDDAGTAVSFDASENPVLTGYFSQTAGFEATDLSSAGGTDVFLAGYTPQGNVRFVRRAGGSGDDAGTGIAAGSDHYILAVGSFQNAAGFGSAIVATHAQNEMFLTTLSLFPGLGDITGDGRIGLDDALIILQLLSSTRR